MPAGKATKKRPSVPGEQLTDSPVSLLPWVSSPASEWGSSHSAISSGTRLAEVFVDPSFSDGKREPLAFFSSASRKSLSGEKVTCI